MYQTGGNDK